MISKPLLIAIVTLTALLGLASFGLYKQVQKNGELGVEIEAKAAEIKAGEELIAKERTNAQDAANRSLARIIDEENRDAELKKLRACVSAGTCGVRMRYQTCPTLPSSTTTGSGTSAGSSQSERDFQSWYFDNIALMNKYEVRIKALEKEVIARSRPDYCQPK